MPWAKACSTALLVKSFILLPVLVISKHLKSLRVAQTLVRGRQMWPLPFWRSSWNSQLILGGHFSCPSVTVELLPRSHGSRGSWDPSTSIEDFNYLSGLTALSVPVWSFPVMFMQLLHSSTIYPPAALHSLSCVYVLWLEYFAWTFLDLPSIFTAGSHTWSINFPCCQPASHQKLSTWLPARHEEHSSSHPASLPWGRPEAGKQQRQELEIPPHSLTALLCWAKDIRTTSSVFLAIISYNIKTQWVWVCFWGRP